MPNYAAFVSLLAVLFYFYTGVAVARARARFRIKAPAVSGHPDFERYFRVQANTLEWMPIFLPSLWLFALYVTDMGAAAIGLVWIIPSSEPCIHLVLPRTGGVKDGAATAKGGLSLTAPSTEACWMPLGPRKFFDAARRALLLFGMDTEALPVWDEEDEAEQSEGRP
jgi:MAPEG family